MREGGSLPGLGGGGGGGGGGGSVHNKREGVRWRGEVVPLGMVLSL